MAYSQVHMQYVFQRCAQNRYGSRYYDLIVNYIPSVLRAYLCNLYAHCDPVCVLVQLCLSEQDMGQSEWPIPCSDLCYQTINKWYLYYRLILDCPTQIEASFYIYIPDYISYFESLLFTQQYFSFYYTANEFTYCFKEMV